MAGKWEGFTEDDIKYYLDQNPDSSTSNGDVSRLKVVSFKNSISKKNIVREKNLPVRKSSTEQSDIPESALLLKPTKTNSRERLAAESSSNSHHIPLEPKVLITTSAVRPIIEENVEVKAEELVDPAKTLELFQARQKLLEEQNRQRKQFLTKVLSDKKKQTTDEARRLQKIQDELQKLDILLSNDVGILRDEIEVAAMEFGEAQKRFNRAEKEFSEAKQLLFSKLERKELLTKHLCTIIEQNEVRKAEKLSELMNQLSVEPSAISATSVTEDKAETSLSSENPSFTPDIVASPGVS